MAASGAKNAPLVLPSWRDLDPDSDFMNRLFRKPLPPNVEHQLQYTYGNIETVKFGENSDGVVPLSSQLRDEAQLETSLQFGINKNHTGVLKDKAPIDRIINSIHEVKSVWPESHLTFLQQGGYEIDLGDEYSELEKHIVQTMGKYLTALSNGTLSTMGNSSLEHFVDVSQGKAEPRTTHEKAWLKFIRDHPEHPQSGVTDR